VPYLFVAGHDPGQEYLGWLTEALPQAEVTVAVRPPIVPRPPPRPLTGADGRGGWYSERATA